MDDLASDVAKISDSDDQDTNDGQASLRSWHARVQSMNLEDAFT